MEHIAYKMGNSTPKWTKLEENKVALFPALVSLTDFFFISNMYFLKWAFSFRHSNATFQFVITLYIRATLIAVY